MVTILRNVLRQINYEKEVVQTLLSRAQFQEVWGNPMIGIRWKIVKDLVELLDSITEITQCLRSQTTPTMFRRFYRICFDVYTSLAIVCCMAPISSEEEGKLYEDDKFQN